MTDFSTLQSKVNALKAMVAANSITPTYLGALLDDFITQMKAIDMTDMADDVASAVKNAIDALANSISALEKANAANSTADAATSTANSIYDIACTARDAAENAVSTVSAIQSAVADKVRELEQRVYEAEAPSDSLREYADEAAETAARNMQKEMNIFAFNGIAPSAGAIAVDNEGIIWVTNEKQFYKQGTKVYIGTDGKPRTDLIYSYNGRLYNIVDGDLCKLIREDELNTVKSEMMEEIDSQDSYLKQYAEQKASEAVDKTGIYEVEAMVNSLDELENPKVGAMYWHCDERKLYECTEFGWMEAFMLLGECVAGRYLFRYQGNLYRLEDDDLIELADKRFVDNAIASNNTTTMQAIDAAKDDAVDNAAVYADEVGEFAVKQSMKQVGIYPFDGVTGSDGSMPADGKIYWVAGEKRFKSKKESGQATYHYEPTGGYADRNLIYRCGNRLYKVTSENLLVEFVDSDTLENRALQVENYVISVADETVWRAKEELLADLWEHFTVWTPFGGVASEANIFPHFSLKLGGVEIGEDGYLKYKLFGFELTCEDALEVLTKPDPACFNSKGSIQCYLAQFNGNYGRLELTIPRQPLQYFTGNFDMSVLQNGMRAHILPQITLQAYENSLAEAVMVYGCSVNSFSGCTQLRELYLLLPPTNLNLSSCSHLSEESVVRFIELSNAYRGIGKNISTNLSLHPAVFGSLSAETQALASNSLVTIVCANN